MTEEGGITVHGGQVMINIHFLMHYHPQLIDNFPLALVTSLDGDPEVYAIPTITKPLEKSGVKSSRIGDALLISGSDLVELEESYGVFQGFDEVWLFRQHPMSYDPPGALIVGPADLRPRMPSAAPPDDLREGVPPAAEEWMLDSGCVLGLGDGTGLNYVTINRDIADYLEEASREAD